MAFTLPELPYAYTVLEPAIDEETMHLHHDKHHAAYVNNLNAALEGTEWANKSIEEVLQSLQSIPEEKRSAVRFNGGGHYNHSLFWQMMRPGEGGEPTGRLAEMITADFGSFTTFKEQFAKAATGVQGSGWAWLVVMDSKLEIVVTPNQFNPIMDTKKKPILGLDVWEHAYYLKYQNRRPEYIENWWKVVDWDFVNKALGA